MPPDGDRFLIRTHVQDGEERAFGRVGVTDEERAAAGRETVAARNQALLGPNRTRAARQHGEPLPVGSHLARVWQPRDPAALRARLGDDALAVWADGDDLHVLWRGAAEVVEIYGGLSAGLWPVEGASDLWEASLRVRDLARAALSVSVLPQPAAESGGSTPEIREWHGPDAAALVPAVPELSGTIGEHVLPGAALGAPRTVTVYRPPATTGPSPVCVLADGESTHHFAQVLEPAVATGDAPAVLVVGVHSGPVERGHDRRAQEYVPGRHRRRFAAHLAWVIDEVLPWARLEHGATGAQATAAGYSNGAVWAITAAQRRPDVFPQVIGLSAGLPPRRVSGAARRAGVRHHLAAGTLESGFRQATAEWACRLERAGLPVHHEEWVGGRDPLWWRQQFVTGLRRLHPRSDRRPTT